MGQYFIAVNEDKKEFIHPHTFGDGLKFFEIVMSGGGFLGALAYLMRRSTYGDGLVDVNEAGSVVGAWAGERVSIVGDYDDSTLYSLAQGGEAGWTNISWEVLEEMAKDGHIRAALDENTYWKRGPDSVKAYPDEVARYNTLFKRKEDGDDENKD